jgi:hypothetical protein
MSTVIGACARLANMYGVRCLFDRQTDELPKLEGWDSFEKRRRGLRSALRLMMWDR